MKLFFVLALFIFIAPLHAKKIVFLGDSLTEGYGIPLDKAYPKLIEKELKKSFPKLTVVNAGSSGSTTASALSRLKWLLKSKPDILFIALGGNDGLRGVNVNASETNLQQAIDLAKNNNVQVILAGVRIPMNYGEKYRKNFENIFIRLAKKNKITFIPYLLKGVAGVKELNLPDGIHPNVKGHEVIMKNTLPTIKKLL